VDKKLKNFRSMLHETDHELSRSRRILRRLTVATIHNKIILILIIVIQVRTPLCSNSAVWL